MTKEYFHSVRLDKDRCSGCTNCIKGCPTEAIRVQNGKARITEQRCIDCGECIRICPYHAKKAVTDPLSAINAFKYKIALPPPSLYGQFKATKQIDHLLAGLKAMGFDDVVEVARGAEIAASAVRQRLDKADMKPLISSACPAVVRLIQVRFPDLTENIVDVLSPMEIAAQIAKKEFSEKHGVPEEEIGVYFITPCPAKMTSIRNPLVRSKSSVDGAISVLEVYGLLAGQLKGNLPPFDGEKASSKGVGWAKAGGETAAIGDINALAVDGILNVLRALEDIEDEKLQDVDFFEGLACPGGCVGGPLVFESPYVAQVRIQRLCDMLGLKNWDPEKLQSYVDAGLADTEKDIQPLDVMRLDSDLSTAMRKVQQIEELEKVLPGMDCGSCGAPSCRALAEDIVRGEANELDCVFILKQRVQSLAEQMVDLASSESRREHWEREK